MEGRTLQLVYLSRACGGWDDLKLSVVQRTSEQHNRSSGVTGLLLFDGSRFIQALEGAEPAVRATMERINADRRHDSIQIASNRIVPSRQFGSWSMQCRRAPPGSCSMLFVGKIKKAMAEVNDPALQALFIGFAVMASK